jgi:hypothetical protein
MQLRRPRERVSHCPCFRCPAGGTWKHLEVSSTTQEIATGAILRQGYRDCINSGMYLVALYSWLVCLFIENVSDHDLSRSWDLQHEVGAVDSLVQHPRGFDGRCGVTHQSRGYLDRNEPVGPPLAWNNGRRRSKASVMSPITSSQYAFSADRRTILADRAPRRSPRTPGSPW